MAKKEIELEKVSAGEVQTFKIRNRKGYAVVCKNNLTEGATPKQAAERMNKALKRIGCILP